MAKHYGTFGWAAFILMAFVLSGTAVAQEHQHGQPPAKAAPRGMGPGMGMSPGMMGHGMMGHGMGMGKMGMMGMMGMHSFAHWLVLHADELKLTDEQIGKLHRIEVRRGEERDKHMGTAHGSMMDFHETLMDPAAGEAKMREAAKKHTDAMNVMTDLAIKEKAEAIAVLTDAQRKTLATMKPDQKATTE